MLLAQIRNSDEQKLYLVNFLSVTNGIAESCAECPKDSLLASHSCCV